MSNKVLILMATVLLFSASQLQADVIHSTWVGGGWGRWSDASNWTPAIVPDNTSWRTFVVTIDSDSIGVDEVEVYLQEDRTINRLDSYGEVGLETSTPFRVVLTLADANGITNYGDLEMAGQAQQIEIRGNVTNMEHATLGLGAVEIHGDLRNRAEAIIEVEAENDIHQGGLQNDGTLIIMHASDLLVDKKIQNVGLIQLFGGACGSGEILDNNNTGVIKGFGVLYTDQHLQNKGTIYAYGGSLAVSSEGGLINEGVLGNLTPSSLHIKQATDVNNLGTIKVHTGGGVGIDCNVVNQPNGVIQLLGGSLGAQKITQRENAAWQGFGGISVPNEIQIESGAKIKLTGPTNIVGDVNIPENARLEISDGTTLITGHTTNNGDIRVVNGDVIFQGGYSGSGVVQKD